jgi:putative ABC transport system permease protein
LNLGDAFAVSIEALVSNKLRACLTMLGIVIGIGAVIALMAVGQGSQKAVQDRIAGLGSNLLFIEPGSTNQGGGLQGGIGTARTLTTEDVDALSTNVPGVEEAVAEIRVPSQISANGTNTFARIDGVTSDYANVLHFTMADGEFFSSFDVDSDKTVAVLGAKIAQTLFGDSEPVGQRIRVGVGRNTFISLDVVGLLTSTGGTSATSQDNFIYVPISIAMRRLPQDERGSNGFPVSEITAQVTDKNQISATKQAVTQFLLQRHRVSTPDFVVSSQDDIAATANAVNQSMTVLLGAIAGISLLVGGIGIMNIMLVSVTERTREIGIRKAVGARQSDIMMQFLTEALTVTLLGGLIGVTVGIGSADFVNGRSIAGLGNNVQTVVSWTSVAAAFGVSALIGVFFGLYPAHRAASLRPIDALHYE